MAKKKVTKKKVTKKKSTVTIAVRVEPELRAKLEYMTLGSGFCLADHIKAALAFYIRGYERKKGAIPQRFIESRAEELREGII